MATKNITLSDDNLLAEYVPLEKFKGVLEQRLMVSPDLLAMLIRDGQIAEASPGGHFAIGGIWRTIKDAVAGEHAIRLLIADLKPFQLTTSASALTKDNVPVACEFTIELQVNPEKPANVLGLMSNQGVLTKASVLSRLTPHLGERVLSAAVRRVDALELRGNTGIQDKIQADAMKEVERIGADTGLLARVVTVTWGFNEEEKAQILKREQEREQEILEREFKILNRSVEREGQTTIFRLQTDLDIEKKKTTTEDELRRLILSNELSFLDARNTGVRIEEMKALEHELQKNRTQRLDGLKAQLEAEQHAIEMVRTGGLKGDVEREIALRGGKHQVDLAKVGGERRDVEMELAKREKVHELEITRINNEIRIVTRSVEDLDTRQQLALKKLTDLQEIEVDETRKKGQTKAIDDLLTVELRGEDARVDIANKAADAAHRRAQEAAQLAEQSMIEKMRILKDGTPEQILAIQAGFSPAVAGVLVEQAKAKAHDGAERMALMREMVAQAQAGAIRTEEQARQMFQAGMTGAVGVAHGAGGKTPPGAQANPNAEPTTTECPGCHRVIPVTDRHCRHCGRTMRQ